MGHCESDPAPVEKLESRDCEILPVRSIEQAVSVEGQPELGLKRH